MVIFLLLQNKNSSKMKSSSFSSHSTLSWIIDFTSYEGVPMAERGTGVYVGNVEFKLTESPSQETPCKLATPVL